MCALPMRFTLCLGLLAMTGCDHDEPSTFPSGLFPATNSTSMPVPQPTAQIPTTNIQVGDVVHGSIGPGDPICDPSGWDARAPCKRFLLTPSRDGTLKVTLTATSPFPVPSDAIDLMLFAAPSFQGAPLEYSTRSVSASVIEGRTYEIRINSYPYLLTPPGNLDFELKTEM